jgi:small ubiquitin-related modifier
VSLARLTTVFFKCKPDTKLEKLMRAFCQRQGVAMESVRFLFDGNRIRENQTPNELEMEDGDSIRVVDRLLEKTRRHVPKRY